MARFVMSYLLLFFSLGVSVAAENNTDPAQGSLERVTANQNTIEQIRAAFEEAMKKDSFAELEPYIAEDFNGTMVTGEHVTGLEGLRSFHAKLRRFLGNGGSYQPKLRPSWAKFYDEVAIVSGSTDEQLVLGTGTKFELVSNWLAVLMDHNGSWKLARFQATLEPFNNPFVGKRIEKTRFYFGGAGLAIGLVVGYLLTMLPRGRKSP